MQPRIIARSEHSISRKLIDSDALKVLYRLYRSGHTAFLVGGGVRDLLIGRSPKDFDISTSARPGQVKKLFRNCWLIGRRFRLAHIHFRDHKIVEVSTFRAEPQRDQGESDEDLLVRQDNTFGTPEEDALRRDFTINGLFYDIASFSLIDYVGGVDDIESGVIRTIGDPSIRFKEDPVRMLRAIKFAARLDFSIEPETWEAICSHAEEIRKSSPARVLEEIARLTEGGGLCRSVQLLKASGLLPIVLPELHEYLHGTPAGPGMQVPSARVIPSAEGLEIEQLLHADEDSDLAAQERMFLEGGQAPDSGPEVHSEPLATDPDGVELDGKGLSEPLEDRGLTVSEDEAEEDLDASLALGDEEGGQAYLTEDGLRVPLSPDRGAQLWRTLSSVDQLIRKGRTLTRPTVFAALFHPLLQHASEWRAERHGGAAESHTVSLLRPITGSLVITRRDRERVFQMLATQRKMERGPRASARQLASKPYFAEALDLFEIVSLASVTGLQTLADWRRDFPPLQLPKVLGRVTSPTPVEGRDAAEGGRSRRSRRRRGGRGGREEAAGDVLDALAEDITGRKGAPRPSSGAAEPSPETRSRLRSLSAVEHSARAQASESRSHRLVGADLEPHSVRSEGRREPSLGDESSWTSVSLPARDSRGAEVRDPRGRRERRDRSSERVDRDLTRVVGERESRPVRSEARERPVREEGVGVTSGRRSSRPAREDVGERTSPDRADAADRGGRERSRLSRRGTRGRSGLKMSERVGGDLTADSAPPPREETRRRRRRPSVASR